MNKVQIELYIANCPFEYVAKKVTQSLPQFTILAMQSIFLIGFFCGIHPDIWVDMWPKFSRQFGHVA